MAGRFQDPPQSSLPAVHEVRSGPHDQTPRYIFTPVWFRWFLDLVKFINMSGGLGGAAPANSPFVTASLDATLTGERVITGGLGIGIVDGGANAPITISTIAGAAVVTGMEDGYFSGEESNFPPGVNGTGTAASPSSITVTQVTVNLPAPARLAHSVSVADGTVGAGSKIMVSLAGVAVGAPNELEDLGPCILGALPAAGSFNLQIAFAQPAVGPIVLNYMVG